LNVIFFLLSLIFFILGLSIPAIAEEEDAKDGDDAPENGVAPENEMPVEDKLQLPDEPPVDDIEPDNGDFYFEDEIDADYIEEFPEDEIPGEEEEAEEAGEEPLPELTNLSAKPEIGKLIISWDPIDKDELDHIELFGKYRKDEFFWKICDCPAQVTSIEIDAHPLATLSVMAQLVFSDGVRSEGQIVKAAALHKNVVFDDYEGREMQIYLPDGYHEEDRVYPVIYMHDGQNLFSEQIAFLWDWRVDEVMDRLIREGKIEKCVVVGIYNSSRRAQEYTPFADINFGGGEARKFSAYIVEKLIPYLEKKYRVSNKREDRAVMGSSFGGILSLWMGYTYPDVFSMVAAISPSLWIADGAMLHILGIEKKKDIKIWIDQGTGEFSDFTRNAVDIFLEKGYEYGKNLAYYEVKGAEHNEVAWSERIEYPFILFKGKPRKKMVKLKINVEKVRQFAAGEYRVVVNPVATFDNGIRYSVYKTAEYSIGQKSKATIDETGNLHFNGARYACVQVKYGNIEESFVLKNPVPSKKTKKAGRRKRKTIEGKKKTALRNWKRKKTKKR